MRIGRRLWTEENVTFEGRFTQVSDLTLSPKPVQQAIPLWIGARADKTIQRCKNGHLMAKIGPDPAPLYIETLRENGYDPAGFHRTNPDGLRLWTGKKMHYSMQYCVILAEANDAPGDADGWQASQLRRFGRAAMIGTPDQVARKMEKFCQRFHCTLMGTQLPGLDPQKVTRSLELFARK